MSELYEFILEVGKDRRLFIGDDDFLSLKHLIDGYGLCLQKHGFPVDDEIVSFEKYVCSYYSEERDSTSLWTRIYRHAETEEEAFTKYFELVRLFYTVEYEEDMRVRTR